MNPAPLLEPFLFAGRLCGRGFNELRHWRLLRTLPRREAATRKRYFADPAAEAEGILVIQPADIGDMVLTSVFLRRLREAFPAERIVVACAPLPSRLLSACPLVDTVVPLDLKKLAGPRWEKCLPGHAAWWDAAARLREEHFPLRPPLHAFALRGERDSLTAAAQIIATSSRARVRSGYRMKNNPLYGVLRSGELLDVTLRIPAWGAPHETARQLALLAAAAPEATITDRPAALPELWIDSAARAHADALWADLHAKTPSFALLGIGAGKPDKKWPKEHFSHLARRLQEEKGLGIAFLGGPEDQADAEAVIALGGLDPQRTRNLAGTLPLEVTAVFVGGASLFVGNDSGPMHLAAASAASFPVLGLFGAQDMERWRPLSPRFHALREPDLPALAPDLVFDRAAALLP